MNKTLKTILSLVLALAMTMSIVGCTTAAPAAESGAAAPAAEAAPAGDTTLVVWLPNTFSKDADALLQARCEDFGASKGVNVAVEFISATDGYAKWNAAIESGDVPDVTYLHPTAFANYANKGLLVDVGDVIDDVEAAYSPMIANHKANMQIGGKYYSVPLYTQLNAMTYRTDVMEAAGYTQPPKTWKEFLDYGAAVKATSPDMYAFGNSFGVADDGEDVLQVILRSFGAYFWDKDGNVAINCPEAVEAVKFLAEMYNAGFMPPTVVEWDAGGNNASYLSGESAVVFNPPTLWKAANNDDNKDTLGVVTDICPLPTGDHEMWACCGYIMFSIFEQAKNKELAKELIEYLYEADWYEDYIALGFPIVGPVFQKSTEMEVWQSDLGQRMLPQGEIGRLYGTPCSDPRVIAADAQSVNDFVVSKTMQKVVLNGMSPEDAVAELAAELQKILDGIA